MKKAMVGLSRNNTLKFEIKPLGDPFIVLLALLEPDIPPLPHDPPRALSGIYICVPKPLHVNKAPQKNRKMQFRFGVAFMRGVSRAKPSSKVHRVWIRSSLRTPLRLQASRTLDLHLFIRLFHLLQLLLLA